MRILLTGVAGFIGHAVAHKLLNRGDTVLGIDNLNSYYDVNLKKSRLQNLNTKTGFEFRKIDVIDSLQLRSAFSQFRPDRICHLAAQAGVRYSLENPHAYIDSNVVGFLNILECCRTFGTEHLVYASSSSVYGANTKSPFSVSDNVDHPVSLYAATKKSNELMAHTYSHLFSLPTTGLRFFTVYGPWGRPDMALWIFAKAISEGKKFQLFNFGKMRRDFTFIDDIVEGVVRTIDKVATPNPVWNSASPSPESSRAPYRLFNIGNNNPVELVEIVALLEDFIGKKAEYDLVPIQPGDVPETCADVSALMEWVGFSPQTDIRTGLHSFVAWLKDYLQNTRNGQS
jgi:UDP-glucuronate 4-epimerase